VERTISQGRVLPQRMRFMNEVSSRAYLRVTNYQHSASWRRQRLSAVGFENQDGQNAYMMSASLFAMVAILNSVLASQPMSSCTGEQTG